MTIHVYLTHVQSSVTEDFNYNILSIPHNALEYTYIVQKYTCTYICLCIYVHVHLHCYELLGGLLMRTMKLQV